VESLIGLDKAKGHLGVHDIFTAGESSPNRLYSGFRAVIDAKSDQFDQNRLWVKQGRLYIGSTLEAAKPFDEADYFLFYIERIEERDDWSIFNSIQESWNETISKAHLGNNKDIAIAFETFKGIVLQSPDLIWSDRTRLIDALSKKVKEIREYQQRRRFRAVGQDTNINQSLSRAISIAEARNLHRADILQMSWK